MIVTAYYRKCYSSLSSAWISNFPLPELFSICLFTKFPNYDVNIEDNTNLAVCNHLSKGVIYLAKMELHVWQKAIYLNILWCDQNHAPFQAIHSKLFPGNARNPLQTDGRSDENTVRVDRADGQIYEETEEIFWVGRSVGQTNRLPEIIMFLAPKGISKIYYSLYYEHIHVVQSKIFVSLGSISNLAQSAHFPVNMKRQIVGLGKK